MFALDAFLPFQVEDASSSAFILYLIRAIAPTLIPNESWCENLDCVLDKLVSKGNPAAPLRRLELKQLDLMLAPLTPTTLMEHPSMTPIRSNDIREHYGNDNINHGVFGLDHQVSTGEEEIGWNMLALNHAVSLPPQELLDLADQLDVDSILHPIGN